jgi:hypothetical protein
MDESTKPAMTSHERFSAALASVLSTSLDSVRQKEAEANSEKPSLNERYSYDPEEAQS